MFSIKDKCLLLIIVVSIFNSSLQAQDSVYRFRSAGGVIGYGHQINLETRYNPVFFAGDFSWQFGKKKRKEFVAFYLEPQFNLVATIRPVDIEFGSNIGIRYYQQLSPGFYLYQMLGSGPHFITADLPRQAKGFIFSDNLGIGFFKLVDDKRSLFLNFRFFVRHISNASLKQPNKGVNTLNLMAGLSKLK
ncbi:MAG TPA: acyloxyacyl hydrolase [Flavisolibacter sp.]|jgi:hypothetical protein|nr:acyloxyacyl hydrolase [Flavisolibacter sp.]